MAFSDNKFEQLFGSRIVNCEYVEDAIKHGQYSIFAGNCSVGCNVIIVP